MFAGAASQSSTPDYLELLTLAHNECAAAARPLYYDAGGRPIMIELDEPAGARHVPHELEDYITRQPLCRRQKPMLGPDQLVMGESDSARRVMAGYL